MTPGTHTFGPADGTLLVLTTRTGAAAKAGHDLVIEVTSWSATLEVGAQTTLAVEADGGSLRVREGNGGIKPLSDKDKESIEATIDTILEKQPVRFRSTSAQQAAGGFRVDGELTLLGNDRPIAIDIKAGEDGRVTANVAFKQTDWGIKPYSTLFGTLQVVDEVTVTFEATPPA